MRFAGAIHNNICMWMCVFVWLSVCIRVTAVSPLWTHVWWHSKSGVSGETMQATKIEGQLVMLVMSNVHIYREREKIACPKKKMMMVTKIVTFFTSRMNICRTAYRGWDSDRTRINTSCNITNNKPRVPPPPPPSALASHQSIDIFPIAPIIKLSFNLYKTIIGAQSTYKSKEFNLFNFRTGVMCVNYWKLTIRLSEQNSNKGQYRQRKTITETCIGLSD